MFQQQPFQKWGSGALYLRVMAIKKQQQKFIDQM